MDAIDRLLSQMTLEEKLGQLNLVTADQAVTGAIGSGDLDSEISRGKRRRRLQHLGPRGDHAAAEAAPSRKRASAFRSSSQWTRCTGIRRSFPCRSPKPAPSTPRSGSARRARRRARPRRTASISPSPPCSTSRAIRAGDASSKALAKTLASAPHSPPRRSGASRARRLPRADSIGATAKHFCAYGAPQAGRDYAAVDVSERSLHEVYLPPFDAALRAGCVAIMAAYPSVSGVPMTAHRALLDGYLRKKRGFEGVIMSDYGAVAELLVQGVAGDLAEAAALALKAGVDMDMVSGAYVSRLPEALARGLVEQRQIDAGRAARAHAQARSRLARRSVPSRRLRACSERALREPRAARRPNARSRCS